MSNEKKVKINPFIEDPEELQRLRQPFAYLDGRDNDEGVIVVTKEDKKYVIGDKLYVKYKGIGFYADIDDAISINTYNDEVYIFRHDELSPPTDREYLLLIVYLDDELVDTFLGISGRQDVFDYIVNNAEIIDFNESRILAETTKMKDMWTVYKFMKMMINNNMVENSTNFDPDEYGSIIFMED